MIDVTLQRKPAFFVAGRKTWISGQNNEAFGAFWAQSHQNGLVDRLKALSCQLQDSITHASVIGVSRVEKDPDNRAFDFYIATEVSNGLPLNDLEVFSVPAALWVVFKGKDASVASLIEAEMYAFTQWLPASPYRHDHAPEMEVYPTDGSGVSFWLPVALRQA